MHTHAPHNTNKYVYIWKHDPVSAITTECEPNHHRDAVGKLGMNYANDDTDKPKNAKGRPGALDSVSVALPRETETVPLSTRNA